jgi:hypothetical protein
MKKYALAIRTCAAAAAVLALSMGAGSAQAETPTESRAPITVVKVASQGADEGVAPLLFSETEAPLTPVSSSAVLDECTDACAEVFQACMADGGDPRLCLQKLRSCVRSCGQSAS